EEEGGRHAALSMFQRRQVSTRYIEGCRHFLERNAPGLTHGPQFCAERGHGRLNLTYQAPSPPCPRAAMLQPEIIWASPGSLSQMGSMVRRIPRSVMAIT